MGQDRTGDTMLNISILVVDYYDTIEVPTKLGYMSQDMSILSYPILSYPVQSYPILSYPVQSYPILSYPILSYLSSIGS